MSEQLSFVFMLLTFRSFPTCCSIFGLRRPQKYTYKQGGIHYACTLRHCGRIDIPHRKHKCNNKQFNLQSIYTPN